MKVSPITFKAILFCGAASFLLLRGSAQDLKSRQNEPIKIQRINSPIHLDGLSDEAAWEGIQSLPMAMRSPNYGSDPSEHTEILIAYDNNYLYVAGRFYYSDPSKIQATSFKRDIWTYTTDQMGVLIDGFNDNENASVFITTPSGTRTDVSILNDAEGAPYKNANTSWNTFWDAATQCNEEGWFAEMRIPFSSLRFKENNGQTIMGLSVYRWIAHKNESVCFPLIPERYGGWGGFKPSQAQEVLFEGITSHNPLYITPHLIGGLGQSYKLNESKSEYKRTDKFACNAGLDVKYGLTSNLTLDVTINPDFAQAEADDQVINLTRFSIFFPEKRLFFQERSGNFEFRFEDSNRLFYSRRIGIHSGDQVNIYGGARVVGRVGPWDIGFMNMQTEKSGDLLSENFNVLRLRKQIINPYSYIGGMVTSRIANRNSWNTTYGIDGIFRLFGDEYLTIKAAQTFEDNKENQLISFDPYKFYVNWNRRSSKGLGYDLSFSRSGLDFNPGIGYERRENYTRLGDKIQYGWYPGKSSTLFNHYIFISGITYLRNTDNKPESSDIGLGWGYQTKAGAGGLLSFNKINESIIKMFYFSTDANVPIGDYKFYSVEGELYSIRAKPYGLSTNFKAGSFYDGRHIVIGLSSFADISEHIQLSSFYQINAIEFPARNQRFIGHIGQLKISSFLNSKVSLVSFLQYSSAIDRIITNIRFRYNPHEGHDLYIVYDEGLNTNRLDEIPMLPLTNNRTILIKYNYTFKIGL